MERVIEVSEMASGVDFAGTSLLTEVDQPPNVAGDGFLGRG